MTPDRRPLDAMVSIPIRAGGLIKMQDLRDFIEASGDAGEDEVVWVLDRELRWEAQS